MQNFEQQAELIKLGRVLGVDASELRFLDTAGVADLRLLRQSMSHSLFDEGRRVFRNMARATKLLPHKILVRVARVYGALLCARIAGEMEPDRAIQLAASLPADFLADVSMELDPERTRDIIRGIPVAQVIEVAHVLLGREEYITMARFVDALRDDVLADTIDSIDDDAAMLHIGFFVEDKAHLNKAIVHLSDEQLANMVQVCEAQSLWPEILSLMEHMEESIRMRLANVAGQQEQRIHLSLIKAIEKQDMWPLVLEMVDAMSEEYRPAMANLAAEQQDPILLRLFEVAKAHDMWPLVLKMLAAMTEQHQQHMAQLAREAGENPEQRRLLAKKLGLLEKLTPFLETYAEA